MTYSNVLNPTFDSTTAQFPNLAQVAVTRIGIELKQFFRDRAALVWVIFYPTLFFSLFAVINAGNYLVHPDNPAWAVLFATVWLPGFLAVGVFLGSFQTLAVDLVRERENGTLKRLRATPMPPAAFFLGKFGQVLLVVLAQAALILIVGRFLFDAALPIGAVNWWNLVWVMLLGAAAGGAAGIAFSSVFPSTKSAGSIIAGISLVLQFVSGVFLLSPDSPAWVTRLGQAFPLYWMVSGMRRVFLPEQILYRLSPVAPPEFGAIAVALAIWLVLGTVLALLTFRWNSTEQSRLFGLRRSPSPLPANVSITPAMKPKTAVIDTLSGTTRAESVTRAASRSSSSSVVATANTAPGFPPLTGVIATRTVIELRQFFRDRAALIWIFLYPTAFMVLFSLIMNANVVNPYDPEYSFGIARFLLPAFLATGVFLASFQTLASDLVKEREDGTLKRLRSTPMPPLAFFGGKMVAVLITVVAQAALILVVGRAAYGVPLPAGLSGWMNLVWILLLGAAAGSATGIALSSVFRSARSADSIVQGIVLILQFVSGVFMLGAAIPMWIFRIGQVFPLYWIVEGMRRVFVPEWALAAVIPTEPATFGWVALALTAWLVVGLVIALRTFRWKSSDDG
ncbi:MAG: ABC transporter permease [Promicromonosporaceae bacterium]|nr:ABC transporter permease [Promicromonosporaceae bacterium]